MRGRTGRALAAVACGLAAPAAALVLAACGSGDEDAAENGETAPRIVQPGAPGEEPQELAPDEAGSMETPHTDADVEFMQNMILHHRQALRMAELVPDRSGRDDIPLFSTRLEISQADELERMEQWLEARGEEVPPEGAEHDHAGHLPGMLTEEELERLEQASGEEFDRLFLEFMLRHHEGALVMVDELQATPGAGQETDISNFANHVVADQAIEIDRMRTLLAELGG